MSDRQVRHPLFARFLSATPDRSLDPVRRRLTAGLAGRVLEIGSGAGQLFAFYPPEVTVVLAVEPEPYLRARAARAAARAPVPVRVVAGLAEELPAATGAFDAGMASLVLCSVRDPAAALAELRRAIRPGGELRFYEHVRDVSRAFAAYQEAADLIWPLLLGGCHVARDTVAAIAGAGFEITELERQRYAAIGPVGLPAAPHVVGRARSPGAIATMGR